MPGNNGAIAFSFNEDDIEAVVNNADNRVKVADALAQIRAGQDDELPAADGLDALVPPGGDRGKFWVRALKVYGCLATFAAALQAKGFAIQAWDLTPHQVKWDSEKLRAFLGRAASFRCLIRVDGQIKGSGVLVGPSSALTAWHVTAVDAPGNPPSKSRIEVILADGRVIDAVQLPGSSPCGDMEWPPATGRAPKNDLEVKDRHDVALLRLSQVAGINLSFATLASPAYEYAGPASVVLISYPQGQWDGVEFSNLRKLRNLSCRWGYDVRATSGGSSGGGCFDTSFSLFGIHQGRVASGGRLVPLIRFDPIVRQAIEDDETPERLWSLDGTADSGVVVGRDGFFVAYHAAMRGSKRIRGLWVKRVDLSQDVAGMPFTFELLERLVARSASVRAIRVSFDTVVRDLPAEIARRAREIGLEINTPEALAGVGEGQSEPEAVVADRSRRLVDALNEQARRGGFSLWIFFEHPSAAFGDEARWSLAAFVDRAMRVEHLRIALAGFEAVQMPGQSFENVSETLNDGPTGLMIEYLVGVKRVDVLNVINLAAQELGVQISTERANEWAEEALDGLTPVNDYYDSELRAKIASRLKVLILQLTVQEGPL